ncbi:MAG: ABC transporter substrate-binding protein [Burkholderiales bacterium]|nr:MAG: ABC transporter substrate-binding protein [Burkholderiales bacterium]
MNLWRSMRRRLASPVGAMAHVSAGLVICLGTVLSPWFTDAADAQTRPQRIVSMNLCTDELLMRIADPSRIASITYLSQQPINAPLGLGGITSRLKVNHGLAEEVLLQEPDLILAGRYSATTAVSLLRRLGYRIITFDPELTLDDMRANIRKLGQAVGESARAEQVIADFDARLAQLQAQLPGEAKPVFADIGVNNYVAGENTLYTHIVNAAGYRTLGQALGFDGFRYVSLEQILSVEPALMSAATPWTNPPSMSTLALGHPALRNRMRDIPQVAIPERYTTCGAPSALGAVEILVKARLAAEATQ